ncbi:acyltransferase family protein [Actinoplanes sp. NPDC023714]|uniref:acyltransferase family protein n=1 Tax=Actinoplanes sp. NPDC023714 TaxID=3154322 RepID=UPI0033DDA979
MRNRYLDLLRAVAIVRVIVYHHFGWPLLSIVFPAMGVMFAVAGSLTAASLAKRPAGDVVVSRMRRLLPPVWLLGLVAVPAMLYFGWRTEADGQHPFSPASLVFWVLPLGDPPGSDSGAFIWDALWYVRTYLWLVLISPLLYPIFKRVGWPLLALPLLLMVVLERGSFGMPPSVESALWDLSTYGACWLAGFAHRDGRLGRTHPFVVVTGFLALAGTGLYWLVQGHAETGWDLNEVSEAQAVYSLAFVLIALRWQPPIERLVTNPSVDRLVNLLNARAVTVYLWHGAAIAAVWPVLEFVNMEDLGKFEAPITLSITFAVTAVAVILFGWAEDLAAKRRPRLWPADQTPSRPTAEPPGPMPAGWPESAAPAGPADHETPGLRLSPEPSVLSAPPAPSAPAAPSAFSAPAGHPFSAVHSLPASEPSAPGLGSQPAAAGPHAQHHPAAGHARHIPAADEGQHPADQVFRYSAADTARLSHTAGLSAPGLRLSTTDTSPDLRLAPPDAVPPQYYGPRLTSAADARPSASGLPHDRPSAALSGSYHPAGDGPAYQPAGDEPAYRTAGDMPIAGRAAHGYPEDPEPNGYSGVPWAGHHTGHSPAHSAEAGHSSAEHSAMPYAGTARDTWRPAPQRSAGDPDDAATIGYDAP